MKIISDDEKFLIEQANRALASLTVYDPREFSPGTRIHVDARIRELSTLIADRVKQKMAELEAA